MKLMLHDTLIYSNTIIYFTNHKSFTMIKKLLKTTLFITLLFTLFSCSSDDNSNNPFEGQWSGNLNGDIEGTWNATINSSGKFNGIVNTVSPSEVFILKGSVKNNGQLVATMKNAEFGITIDFVGQFNETNANGTWEFVGSGLQGTWNGSPE